MKPHGNLKIYRDTSNLRNNGVHGKLSTLESNEVLPDVVNGILESSCLNDCYNIISPEDSPLLPKVNGASLTTKTMHNQNRQTYIMVDSDHIDREKMRFESRTAMDLVQLGSAGRVAEHHARPEKDI